MRRAIPMLLAGMLALAIAGPAAANHNQQHTLNQTAQGAVQTALVGVIVQAVVQDVADVTISDSLNNLLQGAVIDVEVLNRSLNRVLQNVNVQDVTINVLSPEGDLVLTVTILGGTVVDVS